MFSSWVVGREWWGKICLSVDSSIVEWGEDVETRAAILLVCHACIGALLKVRVRYGMFACAAIGGYSLTGVLAMYYVTGEHAFLVEWKVDVCTP